MRSAETKANFGFDVIRAPLEWFWFLHGNVAGEVVFLCQERARTCTHVLTADVGIVEAGESDAALASDALKRVFIEVFQPGVSVAHVLVCHHGLEGPIEGYVHVPLALDALLVGLVVFEPYLSSVSDLACMRTQLSDGLPGFSVTVRMGVHQALDCVIELVRTPESDESERHHEGVCVAILLELESHQLLAYFGCAKTDGLDSSRKAQVFTRGVPGKPPPRPPPNLPGDVGVLPVTVMPMEALPLATSARGGLLERVMELDPAVAGVAWLSMMASHTVGLVGVALEFPRLLILGHAAVLDFDQVFGGRHAHP